MRLVTLARAGRSSAGLVVGDEIVDLQAAATAVDAARLLPRTVRAILAAGDPALDLLRHVADDVMGRQAIADRLRATHALVPSDGATLGPAIADPGIVLACGLNYRAHLAEMNTPVPDAPMAFTKSVASIVGPGQPIVLPREHPDMVDWEGEFCAVIGWPCHRVGAAEALDHVAGYTLINDVSARDWVAPIFQATGTMGPILAWERNILGKQYPTFCPLGPCVVTRDELPDPNHVQLTTRLNGEVMQSANTSDLVFDVAHVIAHFSQFYRFLPGDVISTGSPAGVGFGRAPPVFMRPGDLIEVHAEGIGALYNPIEAE